MTVDFTTGISGQKFSDFQAEGAAEAADFPDGHRRHEALGATAVGEHDPRTGQAEADVHTSGAGARQTPPATKEGSAPISAASLVDPLLALLADALDDLERTRIANENRLRQLTRDGTDADGEERGFGLTLGQPQVAALADVVQALGTMEHAATLNLQRALRKHPLGPWVKATVGVGEKQGARLIAAIGDPYWNTLYDRPRLVSELWAYCGLHVLPAAHPSTASHGGHGGGGQTHPGQSGAESHTPLAGVIKQGGPGHTSCEAQSLSVGVAPTRTRGQRANWSTTAKTRVYLVAESCIKQARSPYRAVYDDGRTKYADALHQAPCRRCGPAGKPAAAGTPLSAGHQHARAMRLVMKAVLRDLWAESKRLHEHT